jgi:hypothetical protein
LGNGNGTFRDAYEPRKHHDGSDNYRGKIHCYFVTDAGKFPPETSDGTPWFKTIKPFRVGHRPRLNISEESKSELRALLLPRPGIKNELERCSCELHKIDWELDDEEEGSLSNVDLAFSDLLKLSVTKMIRATCCKAVGDAVRLGCSWESGEGVHEKSGAFFKTRKRDAIPKRVGLLRKASR